MLISCLRRSACALLLCAVAASRFCPGGERADTVPAVSSEDVVRSTVRIRVEIDTGRSYVIGNGSAFGVDLKAYGLQKPRYLLTAAHLVLSEDGGRLVNGRIKVELPMGERKIWAPCRVLAVTRVYDLCLLECESDVPFISKLMSTKSGVNVGAKILVVGCPLGVPPQVSSGVLADKEPVVNERYRRVWEASAAFNHGNSGGPVFSDAGTVLGVAVAGVRAGGGGPQDMDPRIALFTPYYCVKHFLDVSIVKMAQ